MPSAIILDTASSTIAEAELPKLRLATAGAPAGWSAITQLAASRKTEIGRVNEHPATLTGTIVAALATPHVAPPIVAATWVPCPTQSPLEPSNDQPRLARPPNSTWVLRTPESITYTVTPAPVVVVV